MSLITSSEIANPEQSLATGVHRNFWKWLAVTVIMSVSLSMLAFLYVSSFRFHPGRFNELGEFSINNGVIVNEALHLTIKPTGNWQFSQSPQDYAITVEEDRSRERLICQLIGPTPSNPQLVHQPIVSVSVRYHGDDFTSTRNTVLQSLIASTLDKMNPDLKLLARTPVVEGRKFGDIGSAFCTMKFKEPNRTAIARKIYVIPQGLYDIILRIDFSTGVEDYESFVLEGIEGIIVRKESAVKRWHDANKESSTTPARRFYSGE